MLECDLIMKGGITSGVVYPHAIAEIATKYRLRDIGGASAGAIAAAFAAAAEYRRQTAEPHESRDAGFDEIRAVADELAADMRGLFQPSPRLKPLFDVMMAVLERPTGRPAPVAAALALVRTYRGRAAAGLALAAAGFVAAGVFGAVALGALGLVAGAVLAAALIGLALFRGVARDLPDEDFGVCPGLATSAGGGRPGMTDWIADKIDRIAGNVGPDGSLGDPLTVGQLARAGVTVAAMTTDLSSGRPYQLPMKNRLHYFSRREFEAIFPQRVVDYLVRVGPKLDHGIPGGPDDLHRLPDGDAFPVLLAARLSLSFPGLVRAVGLYRFDHGLEGEGATRGALRRCLFSDGGISSNFPIHFFDAMLPSRPTFGIALAPWEEARHGQERVDLPDRPHQSTSLPIKPVVGLAGFFGAILNTAKDWQDTLQSLLPGYAERIAVIRLDPAKEGGLNLDMDRETIARLAEYGRAAGRRLVEDFDFDEHRYRRALSLLPNLEEALADVATGYRALPDGAEAGTLAYRDILTDYAPKRYRNDAGWRRDVFQAFADRLAAIGDDPVSKRLADGNTPAGDADIRLIASPDRVPDRARRQD